MSDQSPRLNRPALLPHHLAELRASGLKDEIIAEAEIRSETFPDKVRYALNWNRAVKNCAPAIIYSFWDLATGQPNGHCQVKLDSPRFDGKKQKPIQYGSPKGAPNRLYVVKKSIPVLRNKSVSLIFTEGINKALAAEQAGFCAVVLPGVLAWKKKEQEWTIPDFDQIDLNGRLCRIIFDSDAADNPQVQNAETRLAKMLTARDAVVKIVRLLGGIADADGKTEKVGLDDYLV
ncbi:MAG: DUF3854 domain-containing protein [Planctomycetaceae bacterium]|nr:DUF3854 domain-containing protein [Planctomycetaceae bacterium]